jgi:hypothetical protein
MFVNIKLKSGPIDQLWDFRYFFLLRKVGFEPTRSVEHRDAYNLTRRAKF